MYYKIVRILLAVSILISVYLIHTILSYYFADYYNVSNYGEKGYYNEEDAENYLRKSGYRFFPEEFFIANSVGNKISQGNTPTSNFKYSFDIKLISRYAENGSYYDDHYNKLCHYFNSISTFDISEMMEDYLFEDYGYAAILKKMESTLRSESFDPQYTAINGKKALKFYAEKGTPTKYFILLSNRRLYFIETKSESGYDLESLSYKYGSQFHFNSFLTNKELGACFFLLILVSAITIGYNYLVHSRMRILNRYALSLFVIGIVSYIINFAIASYLAYVLYTNLNANNLSVLVLASSLVTSFCISTPLCVFYLKKSKEKWDYSYIVPSYLKCKHLHSIKREASKKGYIKYVCYPLMILSLLPLGVCIVIIYSIPILFTCSLSIWFIKWKNWVKESKNIENRKESI